MVDSKLIEITGLWKKEDKKGNTMLSGTLGKSRIVILANTFKDKDNQPDFRLFIAEKQKPEDSQDNNPRSTVRF